MIRMLTSKDLVGFSRVITHKSAESNRNESTIESSFEYFDGNKNGTVDYCVYSIITS